MQVDIDYSKLIIAYLVLINSATFLIFIADKWAAQRSQQRTPEKVLISLQFAGGAYGSIIAMLFSWHKIRKTKFIISSFLSIALLTYLLLVHNHN